MSDNRQHTSAEPKLSWHIFNATICTGLWFLAFAVSIAMVVAVSGGALQQSKAFALVPMFLILVLNFGAMVLASVRASRKATKLKAEA